MWNRVKRLFAKPRQDQQAEQSVLFNTYGTVLPSPPRTFAQQTLAERDIRDPELVEHLRGFVGYVASRGNKEMTTTRYHLMRHIERVQYHVSMQVPAGSLDAFTAWAVQANAVVFVPDGSIRDPWHRVLIDANGVTDGTARIPYPLDAVERQSRTEMELDGRGIHVVRSLSPVVGVDEVRLRDAAEVAGRVRALLVVSTFAESVRDNDPIPMERMREVLPGAFDHLTPVESAFLADPSDAQAVNQLGWRYESLALLAWALGIEPEIPFPSSICDVANLARTLLDAATSGDLDRARLRTGGEILDALDFHYRLHWAIREADLGHRPPLDNVVPGVVVERHYALNWLVRFEDAAWDDVDTPT